MRKWIITGAVIIALVVGGFTVRWWLSPLLAFVDANSDRIQALTDLGQALLWIAAGIAFVIGLWTGRRKPKDEPPPTRYEAEAEDGSTIAQGPGAVAIGAGAQVVTGANVGGDLLGPHARKEVHIHDNTPGAEEKALRRSYLSHLFHQSGALSLAGVDRKAASEAEARLSLAAVYTALLTQTPDRPEGLLMEQPGRSERPDRPPRRLSAVEQLNRQRRLVLLGDPGSGKTTFVNFVALCLAGEALGDPQANLALLKAPLPSDKGQDEKQAAEQPQPWDHGPLLPVRIVLRDFAARSSLPPVGQPASAEHLWRFIEEQLAAAALSDYAPHLRRTLLEEGGLLLLDGLDEVPEAEQRRAQMRQVVEAFAATLPRCRILVTSRTYAYQRQQWRLPGFAEAVLTPFSAGQIDRFVERWYAHIAQVRHLNRQDAQGRAELLKRAIGASERLQALAERPLLLTLMASLHAWRGGSLPEKREELYADAVDLLLDWWESQRVVRDAQGQVEMIQPSLAEWLKVNREKVRELLNELAYQAHAAQPDLAGVADVAEADLVAGLLQISENPDVKPKRLVEYLSQRAGLLIPRGVGVYTFPHRTFQEYLAACHLTDHDYPERLAELARSDPERWREVALLAGAKAAGGTASAIWSLADALCYQECGRAGSSVADTWGAHLAGQALLETANLGQVSERNRDKLERVQRGLVHVLRGGELPALERAQAGRVLAGLGDPRPEVMTVEGMQFCCVPGGPFWMGDGQERHLSEALPEGYWIGRYPVTNAQFEAFVAAGGYEAGHYWSEAERAGMWRAGEFQGRWGAKPRRGPFQYREPLSLPNHPVVGVSWYEALAFSRWLSEWLRGAGALPGGWAVGLPSEAQWEKAARGGMQVPVEALIGAVDLVERGAGVELQANPAPQRRYPWGDKITPDHANYDKTGIGSTTAVGCFPNGASPYGVLDLSGNVWEWCCTKWRDDYTTAPDDDLAGEAGRVVRGGSYDDSARGVRCAYRFRNVPNDCFRDYGFRIVVLPPHHSSL